MEPKLFALGMLWYVAFLFSTTCHEAAHAWTAMRGGDLTAMRAGQVSLNPLPHMKREVFGTVVVPILSFFLFGYMIGWASAPYDPSWQDRYPKRAALMALAGPGANLFIALVAGTLLHIGIGNGLFEPTGQALSLASAASGTGLEGIAQFLSVLFVLNLLLTIFNLFPVPPLDGSTAVGLVLSDSVNRQFQSWIRNPTVAIIGLLIAWNAFPHVFEPILWACVGWIYP